MANNPGSSNFATDNAMAEYLFSYGTLRKADVQRQLFGRTVKCMDDRLTGYRISTIEITDGAFLSKGGEKGQQTLNAAENDSVVVSGTVLELSEAELRTADNYEPDNYKRQRIKLESGKEAWVYFATQTS